MSVNLNNSISVGLKFLVDQAVNVTGKIGEITAKAFHGTKSSIGSLLTDFHPNSASDLLKQIKTAGSAFLVTPRQDYLIEITSDEQGRLIFMAMGESLEPFICHAGSEENSKELWNVQVSNYLQKIINHSESVIYGVVTRRWKGGKFSELKESFRAEGRLKNMGDSVRLKLPGKRAIVFEGPDASVKADLVLKHFYQTRKTPLEEKSGAFSRLLVQYLHIYHYASAPWKNGSWPVGDDFQNRHEFKAISLDTIRQYSCETYDVHPVSGEWALLSEFQEATLRSNDYIHSYLASTSTFFAQSQLGMPALYLATLVTVQDPKVALLSSLFHMIAQANAAPTPETRQITEIKSGSMDQTKRRTSPVTLLNPLPNLSVQPGVALNHNIDLSNYCELSNPNRNLELSIGRANGLPVPSWISMEMGSISAVKTLTLGGSANLVYVSGNTAYVVLGINLLTLDITDLTRPVVLGQLIMTSASSPSGLHVQGGIAYLTLLGASTNTSRVIDVSNPATPTLVRSISYTSQIQGFSIRNNEMHFVQGINYMVANLNNPTNPATTGSLALSGGGSINGVYLSGNYSYVPSTGGFFIVDVSNSTSPSQVARVTLPSGPGLSAAVKGSRLFIGSNQNLYVYDITQIATPALLQTVYLGTQGTAVELDLVGDYLYASFQSGGVVVVDVKDPSNAEVVDAASTIGSATDVFLSGNNVFVADGNAGLTILDAGNRVLRGTPSAGDRGLLLLNVTAQDDLGNKVVDQVAIRVGNPNVVAPANRQVSVGNTTMFTLPAGTFEFPGANYTYSASLVGGQPLPSCIRFDSSSRTFLFTPQSGDQNTYRILVTGNDGYDGVVSTTFDLVVPNRIPIAAQPFGNQTAITGQLFQYIFTSNSFTDGDNDQLSYSANLVGSNALPGWLAFDPALRKFTGTPFGRNTYAIQVNARDAFGGVVSNTFTINVPSSAPVVLNPIGTQLASINNPFSFAPNTNTFFNVDGDPLTLSATGLPSFLTFTNGAFSGTPQSQDAGSYQITLRATNPFGQNVTTTFSLTVLSATNVLPPVLVLEIPELTQTSGIPFNYTINSATFEHPQDLPLTFSATLEGGAPLPSGLNFDATTLTFWGVVALPQSMRISVKATDPYGAFAIDTFSLNVVDGTRYPPIVLNALPGVSATVGQLFSMQVPADTFKAVNGGTFTVTALQSDGQPLPSWLKWNAESQFFSGTPGPGDTDPFSNKVLNIDVWAKDSSGSVKTTFVLSVGGDSYWERLMKYGSISVSLLGAAYGLWRKRAIIWNMLFKKNYQKESETAIVGQPYNHDIKLSHENVEEVRAYRGDKPLPLQKPLPDGLEWDNNRLHGTPSGKDTGRFTIKVVGDQGYINEEFELIIKNSGDADPEIQTGYLESATARVSAVFANCSSRGEEGENRSCLGRIKAGLPKSFEMRGRGDDNI